MQSIYATFFLPVIAHNYQKRNDALSKCQMLELTLLALTPLGSKCQMLELTLLALIINH
jgi:hypothetical protein